MEERKIVVGEMIRQMLDAMEEVGCSKQSLWSRYYPRFKMVERYYKKKGLIYYDPAVSDEYVELFRNRYEQGEITKSHYKDIKYIVTHMTSYFCYGRFFYSPPTKGLRYLISPQNEALIGKFIEHHGYKENTRDDVDWVLRRFFGYMERKGHDSLMTVTPEDARIFVIEMGSEMKLASLKNVLLYLRYFYLFLAEAGYPYPNCSGVFSYKITREMPIQGYVTDDELEKILQQINRETVTGKRDYAIIQLAATTGMRAVDIIHLKLSDIDWKKGEISFSQRKTGQTVYLPITQEVGDALVDYILHARPKVDYSEVFLRVAFPTIPLSNAVAIGDIFINYQKKAGIVRHAFDGKGFHGLRRRLAKKMIEAEIPMTTIAQVLGHKNMCSSRQYIALDTTNLKECAMGFSGIPFTYTDWR